MPPTIGTSGNHGVLKGNGVAGSRPRARMAIPCASVNTIRKIRLAAAPAAATFGSAIIVRTIVAAAASTPATGMPRPLTRPIRAGRVRSRAIAKAMRLAA